VLHSEIVPIKVCSICSAPREVREAIETRRKAGGKGSEYREIAKESGYGYTAIWRHCTRHLTKSVLERNRVFQQGDSLYIWYPDQTTQAEINHINALPKSCWLVAVVYEAPISRDRVEAAQLQKIADTKTLADKKRVEQNAAEEILTTISEEKSEN
jgi:hypothetical protein